MGRKKQYCKSCDWELDDWEKEKNISYEDEYGEDNPITVKYKDFVITIYGIDSDNNRIVCHVTEYRPYFYIKIPNDWEMPDANKLIKYIYECSLKDELHCGREIIRAKDFYGLHWNHASKNTQEFQYLKLSFKSHENMRKFILNTKK